LIAEGAVWLHTIAALPRITEALKLLQGCLLIGAAWLCPVGVEVLLSALRQTDKPWNLMSERSGSNSIIKPWSFGFCSEDSLPVVALSDFLQLGDLLAAHGRWLGHIHSRPLKLVAGEISFSVYLTLSFRHGGECMVRWTGSCSKDMFDNDVELELSGRLISPCHADICPFGTRDQESGTFVLDGDRYNLILQALSGRQDFVCVLQIVVRHVGEEYAAFAVSAEDCITVSNV
jgi:hypothetical protein